MSAVSPTRRGRSSPAPASAGCSRAAGGVRSALAPTGVLVWACTVVVAMVLRKATSQGTAASFIVVASLTTAVLLLGWRVAAQLITRRGKAASVL